MFPPTNVISMLIAVTHGVNSNGAAVCTYFSFCGGFAVLDAGSLLSLT